MCAPTRTLATVATIGTIALAIGAGTAVAAPIVVVGGPALIAGEPKDQPPFTTQAAADPGLIIALHQAATGTIAPQAARRGRRPAQEPTPVGQRPASFSWTEASFGAGFAGAATCLIAAAAILARRRSAVP